MKTLLFLIFLGVAGFFALVALDQPEIPRALIEAFEVAPPLELDYEVKPVLLMFGRQAFLIVTNFSEKPVHPTRLIIASANGKEFKMDVPDVIKAHETIKIALPDLLKAGAKIELDCAGYALPGGLNIVK